MSIQTYTTTLIHKKDIADSVIELRFSKPDGFAFEAGQFVQFEIPVDGKPVLRSYSISSTPADDYLEFCVKLLPDGIASLHLATMNDGDELSFRGPQGRFVCNEDAVKHVFIATGAGLAPIMGMMRDLVENKKSKDPIELLFGVRAQKDIFWQDRLGQLNITHATTLSQPEDGWDGPSGRVTAHLSDIDTSAHYYLCGSAAMVMDVRKHLIAAGVGPKQMHFEIF